jgi:hypothetical protein
MELGCWTSPLDELVADGSRMLLKTSEVEDPADSKVLMGARRFSRSTPSTTAPIPTPSARGLGQGTYIEKQPTALRIPK